MALERGDELGLPWDDWADGRAYPLLRGRDFFRNADVVQEAARNAARRLDKAVSVVKENRVGRTYLWVQFSDFEVERGSPCPGCGGGDTLRVVNPQHAQCLACAATVVLLRPKKEKRIDAGRPPGSDAAGMLVESLLSPAERPAQDLRHSGSINRDEMRDLFERTKQSVPLEEVRRWSRRSYNEAAAIIACGAFSSQRDPIDSFDVADDLELCVLLELGERQLHVRVGIVFGDDAGPRYRVVLVDPVRVARPGRYTFRVVVPGGTFAPDAYDARVSVALVKDGEFSRIARRNAFSLHASTAGDAVELPDEVVSLEDLDWRVEPGDGPWKLSGDGADG